MSRRVVPTEVKVTVVVLTLAVVAVLAVVVVIGKREGRTVLPETEPTTTAAVTVTMALPPTTALPDPVPQPTNTAGATVTTSAPSRPVVLAQLVIDDGVAPAGYERELFPTWLDLDGNGCDARDDALIDESQVPLDPSRCDPSGGRWVSLYEGVVRHGPERARRRPRRAPGRGLAFRGRCLERRTAGCLRQRSRLRGPPHRGHGLHQPVQVRQRTSALAPVAGEHVVPLRHRLGKHQGDLVPHRHHTRT